MKKLDRLVKELTQKADGYKVYLEYTPYDFLWHNSHVFRGTTPYCSGCKGMNKHIIVYYHDDFIKLLALAHEVGHVMTDREAIDTYAKEVLASKWAINWLRGQDVKTKVFVEAYQACLDNYDKNGYRGTMERVNFNSRT